MTPTLMDEPQGGIDRAVRLGLMVLLSALVGLLLVLGLWLEGPSAHGSERTQTVLMDRSEDWNQGPAVAEEPAPQDPMRRRR